MRRLGRDVVLKAEIRRSLLERLKKQNPKIRIRKSRAIEKKLFQRKEFREAKTVMFYVSLPEEVNTRRMIQRSLRLGKRVVVPRVAHRHLEAVSIRNVTRDLARGRFGLLEPKKHLPTVSPWEIDLAVAPGIAFDAKGNRLGRGGGYYDRFLKRLSGRVPVIGLAFKLQRLSSLPTSSRDIPVTTLISA